MNLQEAYEILGIPMGASEAEARAAYKDLVAVWHPDRFPNNARLKQKAEAKLKQINVAFQTIESAGFPKRPSGVAAERPTEPQTTAGPSPPESSTKHRGSRRKWVYAALVLATLCFLIPRTWHKGKHHQVSSNPIAPLHEDGDKTPTPSLALKYPSEMPVPPVDKTQRQPLPMIELSPAVRSTEHEWARGQASSDKKAARYFTLGSTKDEVRRVQGAPTSISGDAWDYEYSSVQFDSNGMVISYSDISHNLKIRVVASSKSQKSVHFTIGSTKDEVLSVQGTPTGISGDAWDYEYSSVNFDSNGAVVSYADISHNLRVRVAPRPKTRNIGTFTMGSNKDEVLAVQGTPTGISGDTWDYEYSSVKFGPEGKVSSYANISNNLKVR